MSDNREFYLNLGLIAVFLDLFVAVGAHQAMAQSPRAYNVDPNSVSVSGISSGADLAHQLHIAHSSVIHGAGLLAASPYYCAKGDETKALQYCSKIGAELGQPYNGPPTEEYIGSLVAMTQSEFTQGRIDDPAGVKTARIYLFSGTNDPKVPQPIVDTVQLYYTKLGVPPDNIQYVKNVPAGHGMVTEDYGHECSASRSPYINNCGVDVAGQILQQIYGSLLPPGQARPDNIKEFGQSKFFVGGDSAQMDENGHAYIPKACAEGARCKLHVAIEGCAQVDDLIKDQFYTRAGYNEWAETNNIVVIYPQVQSGTGNLFSCWDWWGYTDASYHTKNGKQVAAVKRMMDWVVAGDPLPPPEPENSDPCAACSIWTGWLCRLGMWSCN